MRLCTNMMISVVVISLVLMNEVDSKLSQPNILFVLVDDLGWSDVGFHGSKIKTPNIDRLASEGVVLDNYYVQPICSPTRGALMSGRYPIHIGLQHGIVHSPCPFGLPLNITTLPQKLKEAASPSTVDGLLLSVNGQIFTHMLGKWHLGFYNWESTPTYRGFDTFYGFYSGAEDHYSHVQSHFLDFRDNKEIVRDLNGTYSVNAFTKRAIQIVQSHNSSQPLFMYMAFQNVHGPVQAPKEHVDKYLFINDTLRRTYAGMVDIMDEAVGNITNAFEQAGLWDNALMILSTDNGGVPKNGGYDYPLRGRKDTLWEGGIRGVGFVHGKMLSKAGVKYKGLVHVTDWYPTMVNLAGGSLSKEELNDLDGHNVWKAISEGDPSPRREILHNIDTKATLEGLGFAYQGIGLRVGDLKLLMNVPNISYFIPPEERNSSEVNVNMNMIMEGEFEDSPVPLIDVALFNITADPYEKYDLSKQLPKDLVEMQDRLQFYMKGVVPPGNKPPDPESRKVAKKNGAWSPWM